MTADPPVGLADGMRLADVTYPELSTRCFALGGSGTTGDLRRHVESDFCPDDHEHNLIAQALNEIYLQRGRDHPVAYRHLFGRGDVSPD